MGLTDERRVIYLNPEMPLNAWMSQALAATGLPRSEEPNGAANDDQSYIAWRISNTRYLRASGMMLARTIYLTVTLYAPKNADHGAQVEAMTAGLRQAGCLYAVPGAEVWNADTMRRECPVSVAVKVACEP